MSPQYVKMEPEYSSHPANASLYACQETIQYDTTPESQQAGFEHYALHNSPAAAVYAFQACSNQSSPRSSWGSADQFRSLSQQPYPDMSYLPSATSYPASGGYTPSQSFDGSEPSFQLQQDDQFGVYQTAPYPMAAHDGLSAVSELARPLSACSSSFDGLKAEIDLPSPTIKSELGDYPAEISSRHHCPSPQSSTVDSPASGGGGTPGNVSSSKQEEPYAQLIYRAFMSTPRHAMTLQDLYQWFRENTDKGKSDTKGWQNSIRHNLSMNQAFTKRERRHSSAFSNDGIDGSGRLCLSSDAGVSDNKNAKSTEWYLEPYFAKHGVISTTRYRSKNNPRHPGRQGGGYHHRGRDAHLGSPSAGHSNGKKGSHGGGSGSRSRSSRHHGHATNTSSPMHTLAQHYNPSMAAAHHQLHAGHHPLTSMIGDVAAYGAAATAYIDYSTHAAMYAADYAHPHAHAPCSESGVDEPMTPEPSYSDSLLLPDLHRVAAPSSSSRSSNGSYDLDAGYPYPHPAATVGSVEVGVYDEMVERFEWPDDRAAAYHPQY
ncbi:hypothetical protein B0T14DRAFT_559201 [Immersiella caudata]|uniref:Fork-head domain-containing protein n=1 Tax=Immersiella caudata TaxID=314043 RepID=A0AA39XCH0_9PEZI|nr:hypothetical protein B0T14DRAFT_559201 [Immersiella caudata]